MVIKLSQGSEATEKNNSIITAYTINAKRFITKEKKGKIKLLYKKEN